jgi:hypothetical protein
MSPKLMERRRIASLINGSHYRQFLLLPPSIVSSRSGHRNDCMQSSAIRRTIYLTTCIAREIRCVGVSSTHQ